MLFLDIDLPQGALLVDPAEPAQVERDLGGVRYTARSAAEARVLVLDAIPEGPRAVAVEGNDNGCPAATFGETRFLTLEADRGCGFGTEVPIALSAASLAVFFWSPEGDARTLAALCEPESRNYLHLTVRGGRAEFAYRDGQGSVSLETGDTAAEPGLLMASATGETLSLGTETRGPVTAPAETFTPGEKTLFIGCRRFRAGLKNSLGPARIADVVLYPDLDLFAETSADIRATLIAHLEDLRHGV